MEEEELALLPRFDPENRKGIEARGADYEPERPVIRPPPVIPKDSLATASRGTLGMLYPPTVRGLLLTSVTAAVVGSIGAGLALELLIESVKKKGDGQEGGGSAARNGGKGDRPICCNADTCFAC